MHTIDDYLRESMKDPEFAKEYNEFQPQIDLINELIDNNHLQDYTQEEIEKLTKERQRSIKKVSSH